MRFALNCLAILFLSKYFSLILAELILFQLHRTRTADCQEFQNNFFLDSTKNDKRNVAWKKKQKKTKEIFEKCKESIKKAITFSHPSNDVTPRGNDRLFSDICRRRTATKIRRRVTTARIIFKSSKSNSN